MTMTAVTEPVTAQASGEDHEGIRIALSAVQLAAVLEQETVEQGGTIGNRLIGGLRLIGCGIEGLGAGALLAAPEPTMLTKAGGVALGAHAADQCVTGGQQIWTGRDVRSLTERATSSMARSLGASPQAAATAGMLTDFLVPIGGAALAGAVRAGAIRAGRISLLQHEAVAGSRLGGHTIARHVGQTEAQLRARIAATANARRPPDSISSFVDLASAERFVSQALHANKTRIAAWAQSGSAANLVLNFNAGNVVGHGVVRATSQYVPMLSLRVVMKKEIYNGMPHYILTAFPRP